MKVPTKITNLFISIYVERVLSITIGLVKG